MMTPALPPLPRLRAALVFFVVFLGTVQAVVVGVSLCSVRVTRSISLAILAVATAVALLAWTKARKVPVFIVRPEGTSFCSTVVSRGLLITTLSLVGVFVLLGCLSQDLSFDGNAYHIPPINQWAVKGYIHEVDAKFAASEYMNGYPKGAEAVTFVFVQAFGSKLLNMLNLLYAPLGFCGITVLCHLVGARLLDSLLFGACFLLIPANALQYGTTYVDAALGFSVVALLALLAVRLFIGQGDWFAEALPVGCAMGNVIAVKSSGVLLVAVSFASLLVCEIVLSQKHAGLRKRFPTLVGSIGLSLLVALLVGGFWYVRNYIHHGSPLYPVGISVAGHVLWHGELASKAINEVANTPPELLERGRVERVLVSWWHALPFRQWARGGADLRLGGLGVFWILGCVPAILGCAYFLIRGAICDLRVRAVYSFLAVGVALGFLGTPMNWWGRYTVWVFALGFPSIWLVLIAVEDFDRLKRLAGIWARVCVSALILQGAAIMLKLGVLYVAGVPSSAIGFSRHTLLETVPPFPLFPEMKAPLLIQILQTQSSIGVGPRELGSNLRIYGQIARAIGRYKLIPLSASLAEADVRKLNSDASLRYILWLSSTTIPSALAPHVMVRGEDGPFTYLELINSSRKVSSTKTP